MSDFVDTRIPNRYRQSVEGSTMERVFSSPNIGMVHLAQHALETAGIECVTRGEHLAAAAGGIAPIDAWGELWILNVAEVDKARTLIDELLEESDEMEDPWMCPDCIERRDGQFSHCWKCGAERVY